ncbi:hypothetical protein GCM10007859_13330 [Brevundimonas denitrificans]|uniref:Uncharacterized protein n=1 Tax=Brevundimonas denitrificans TaxID=1443434 RepID=A0ABQ6BGZ6_9CAUL|nr:hypothetical protein [Brevundimonas denitrificans]GLS01320.1 hypothetical protein GCM10007859_13330 [Brevundimonas denitrificans]
MPVNDTLDLIFDGPDVVPWPRVSLMVAALEKAEGEALCAIHKRLWPGRDNITPDRMAPNAALAASPKAGSLIVPLVFEAAEIYSAFASPDVRNVMGDVSLGRLLSAVADTSGVIMFAHFLLFGPWGFVAKVTNQRTREPTVEERPLAEIADLVYGDGAVNWVENLMDAAERTGCERVRVRFRDFEADLVIADRRSSSSRLGRRKHSNSVSHTGALRFARRDEESISVVCRGQSRTAYLASGGSDQNSDVIVLGRKLDEFPIGKWMEATGEFVNQMEVQTKDDVPDAWKNANGVFFITGVRPADFT